MNLATETFIKEALASFLGKVSVNGNDYVRTGAFKKRVEREERMMERGELVRDAKGELPVEAEERRKRKVLCMEDLRLALRLGDGYLGQAPMLAGSIANSTFLDVPGIEDIYPAPQSRTEKGRFNSGVNGVVANGIGPAGDKSGLRKWLGEGVSVDLRLDGAGGDIGGERMQGIEGGEDEMEGWNGGSVGEVDGLDGALDDVLNLGEL